MTPPKEPGDSTQAHLEALIRQTLPEARLAATALALCPELRLYLLDPANMQGPFSSEAVRTILERTPYWVFCWASGQAMGRHLLDHPETVRGKKVLDFGAGSGVVAVAAAMAGAGQVIAYDTDPHALVSAQANAELNGASLVTAQQRPPLDAFDVILAADVLYDRDNRPWLAHFAAASADIWVADSRVRRLEEPGYRPVTRIETTTLPDLRELDEHKRVVIYRSLG